MELCVKEAKMPRKEFISSFPGNETNLKWLKDELKKKAPYVEKLKEQEAQILKAQEKLAYIFSDALLIDRR